MTRDELIQIGKDKVRRDSNLMSIYIGLFSEMFGKAPNCAGCTFSNDWQKFISNHNAEVKQTQVLMEKTFRLKKNSSDILSYRVDRGGKMVTHRKYANQLTEEFAIAFLTNGTEPEIAERTKLFAVLPQLPVKDEQAPAKKTRKKRTKKS